MHWAVAFEQLKSRLAAAGLFDESHKQPIPKYPRRIGVATSAYGAAVADIKQITARRFPAAELVIAPTVVQGDGRAGKHYPVYRTAGQNGAGCTDRWPWRRVYGGSVGV